MSQLLSYWTNSLISAELCSPSIQHNTKLKPAWADIVGGNVPVRFVDKIFEYAEKEQKETNDGKLAALEYVDLVIAPFIMVRPISIRPGATREYAPLWISAALDRAGHLIPDGGTKPFIVRELLAPNAGSELLVGETQAQEGFRKENTDLLGQGTWEEHVRFMEALWEFVTKTTVDRLACSGTGTATICIKEADPQGINRNLIELLSSYQTASPALTSPTALNTLISLTENNGYKADEYSKDALVHHSGHVSPNFGLSTSQREANAQIGLLETGDILAIEGPPGTGKTTLMQSAIASGMVNAALKDDQPFVALACSTNNQAVLNLNESLTEAAKSTTDDPFSRRWLPDPSKIIGIPVTLETLGTYFASNDKYKQTDTNTVLAMTLSSRRSWDGGHSLLENSEYFEAARQHYTQTAREVLSPSLSTPSEAKKLLLSKMNKLNSSLEVVSTETSLINDLCTKYHVQDTIVAGKIDALISDAKWPKIEPEAMNLEAHILASEHMSRNTLRDGREQLEIHGFFDWFFPRRRISRASEYFRNNGIHELSDAILEYRKPAQAIQWVNQWMDTANEATKELKRELNRNLAYKTEYTELKLDRQKIARSSALISEELPKHISFEKSAPPTPNECKDLEKVQEIVDRGLRRQLFQLTCRYWEARWLEAMEIYLQEKETAKKKNRSIDAQNGKHIMLERLRRYAMLTPCFVATFFQAAKYFKIKHGAAKDFQLEATWGFFDLIIVDEAGQCSPQVGAGPFALAQKAVCIGDVKQIKPVPTIPDYIDIANINHAGLAERFAYLADPKGQGAPEDCEFRAGTGSIMAAAMSVSRFNLSGGRGMFLREHRRCYDEIISYCNDTFYSGKMIPLKGSAPEVGVAQLPPLGYAHIKGRASRSGGSWKNTGEARAIASWIKENQELIAKNTATPKGDLANAIAVITPFKAQAREVSQALREVGLPEDITVGTVHSLQGAERPCILFSTTYSHSPKKAQSLFFDSDSSILNVAVSRAKFSFLVFGDMDILHPIGANASNLLAKRLFADIKNEIRDVKSSPDLAHDQTVEIARLSSLEDFRGALRSAFNDAREKLLIVSPFLSKAAIEDDEVVDLYHSAKQRGVDVRIVFDELKEGQNKWFQAGRAMLDENDVELHAAQNIHNKTLCVDDRYMVEGSFNWLSANRRSLSQKENAFIYRGPSVAEYIKDAWSEYT